MAGRPWRGTKAQGPRSLKIFDVKVKASEQAPGPASDTRWAPVARDWQDDELRVCAIGVAFVGSLASLFFFLVFSVRLSRITAWDFGQERKVLSDIVCHIRGEPDKGACRPVSRCRVERACRAAPARGGLSAASRSPIRA
jgi:hypothetical protein